MKCGCRRVKEALRLRFFPVRAKKMAERGGFEPPEGYPSSVFKTDALNRSTISPQINRKIKYSKNGKYQGACRKNDKISRKED